MAITTITAQQLHDRQQSGQPIELIDVRTPAEFGEVHVTFARNVPLDRLDPAALRAERGAAVDQPLYVICRSGSRARQACEKLLATGVPVVNVEGGTLAWDQAGLPVVRGKKAMALDRQVRIAAGLLVVIGSAIGYFWNPLGIALAALTGAGLVFAGITDYCPMSAMFGKLPWNQARGSSGASGGGCCVA